VVTAAIAGGKGGIVEPSLKKEEEERMDNTLRQKAGSKKTLKA